MLLGYIDVNLHYMLSHLYICVIVNMVQFTLVNYIIIYYHLASFMPSSIDITYPATSHISTSI